MDNKLKKVEQYSNPNYEIKPYNSEKPLLIDFINNVQLSPKSNVPWVVYENKTTVFKPMILSDFLKNGITNEGKILNYIIVKNNETGNGFSIFCYDNGLYKKMAADEFKGIIRKFIPQLMRTKRSVDEIYADLISEDKFIDEKDLNSNEQFINFQDILLDIKSLKKYPHTPKFLSTIQIPIKYEDIENCNDYCPVFDNYINTLCDNDQDEIKILMQCIGLSISNVYGYRIKKALFLVGKGDTGKSQIKKLVETLLGQQNISTVDLKVLNSRFGKSAMYGKRLVGCNDMSYETIKELDIFKNMTGGDNISLEFKNGGFIDYTYKGFIWFNCNSLPTFGGDKGKWVYNRMIPLICKNPIPKEKQDKMLFEKMMKEKNVIVKKAIFALKELIDNNYNMELTDEMKNTLNDYETENSTLLTFTRECCIDASQLKVKTKRSTFNKCYSSWNKLYNDGKGKVGNNTMKKVLEERYKETYRLSSGIWYMDKLAIKPEVQEELGVYDNI